MTNHALNSLTDPNDSFDEFKSNVGDICVKKQGSEVGESEDSELSKRESEKD